MYGYFRPFKPEMKCAEFDYYKAVYCGLCHSLSREYGFLARMLVNYDAASFYALLPEEPEEESSILLQRCPANPMKKCPAVSGEKVSFLAAVSIILFWWKLVDDKRDGGFFRGIVSRILQLIFHRAYKKAAGRQPQFAALTEQKLEVLRKAENERAAGDLAADCFASITAGLAQVVADTSKARIHGQLLYHAGRAIYYLDAIDDFDKDNQSGAYNPLKTFSCSGAHAKALAAETLEHSFAAMFSAHNLLDRSGITAAIRENLIGYGLPATLEAVMAGKRKGRKSIGPI